MSKKIFTHVLLWAFLGLLNQPLVFAQGQRQGEEKMSGEVVGVMDGDTYDLRVGQQKTIRVRMDGIDAPEKGMPFNKAAKKFLSQMIFRQQVQILVMNRDRHGRIVAKTYTASGKECGEELLKAGLAWHYKQYNQEKALAAMEREARQKRLGIWSEPNPMEPWEVRSLRRKGISTKSQIRSVAENP